MMVFRVIGRRSRFRSAVGLVTVVRMRRRGVRVTWLIGSGLSGLTVRSDRWLADVVAGSVLLVFEGCRSRYRR